MTAFYRLLYGNAGVPVELAVESSGAAAAITATLVAAAGERTYLTGFNVDGLGATAASVISITITGLAVTQTYRLSIPAGVALQITAPLRVQLARPLQASADNTAIVVNVPSFGAGNTQAIVNAQGFRL